MINFKVENVRQQYKEFHSKFRTAGIYYPIGPIIIVNGDFSMAEGEIVPPNKHVLFHEYLHHWHIAGSSIGFFDLFLKLSLASTHFHYWDEIKSFPFKQPYIQHLPLPEDYSTVIFMNLLYTYYVQKIFFGYKPIEHKQFSFPSSIFEAGILFPLVYKAIFPDAMEIFSDLDARLCHSVEMPPAPFFCSKNLHIGSNMIYEGMASDIEMLIANKKEQLVDKIYHTTHMAKNDNDVRKLINDGTINIYDGCRITFINKWFLYLSLQNRDEPFDGCFETYLAIAELAINPPILPSQLHLWKRKPTWLDLHPGYRFCNLAHSLYHTGACRNIGGNPADWHCHLLDYIERLSSYMEWPSYKESMNALCDTEVLDGGLLITRQLKTAKVLVQKKLENIGAYLFGISGRTLQAEYAPLAVLGKHNYVDITGAKEQFGTLLLSTLISSLINEYYFGESLKFTASLLWPFDDISTETLAHKLEEITLIEGVGKVLIREVKRTKKSKIYYDR